MLYSAAMSQPTQIVVVYKVAEIKLCVATHIAPRNETVMLLRPLVGDHIESHDGTEQRDAQ
ncbi:MAG: hypothetical protein ABI831_10340 [Betaproteobacteria bacterium]